MAIEDRIEADVLIIGAGPCGLFQVFELGLLDLKAHVVDSMRQIGGQCAELYPEKPIYDIPAYPVIGAQELVDRLAEQIEPFHPRFHLGQEVQTIQRREDGRFDVTTSRDTRFIARAIVVAGGVGSFRPKQLRLPGHEPIEGRQLHYRVTERERFAGQDVIVLGGGDSALDWALELQPIARSLTLIHRRAEYRAQPASVVRMQELADAGKMQSMQGTIAALRVEEGQLTGIEVLNADRERQLVPGNQLLVFWGLSPKLGPIAEWGLNLERNQIAVDVERFETSDPGIYAIGDICTYPGKKKLILSGFHEAAMAAFAIRHQLYPEEKIRLQYTTTSSVMHERLGVADR